MHSTSRHPISATTADAIRARFTARAVATRHAAETATDPATAARLHRLADSQARMSAKRYESMRVIAHI